MELDFCIRAEGIKKKFKNFRLDIPQLDIPKGYATALIGENGAGKTTLLNILTGIRLDYEGKLDYFGTYTDKDRESGKLKEQIGYTGPGNYYLPHWTIRQIEKISELLFDNFQKERFKQWCSELAVFSGEEIEWKKKVRELSDGTRMKLMLAGVLARDTKLLLLDEPASPLDPLMRDKLCSMIRDYILDGNGEKSVFFSTHNISDMENVTDYAIIMERGKIAEAGFVEDLKEKYLLIKGEREDIEAAGKILYSITTSPYGFEGICLADRMEQLSGMNVSVEVPSLFQISVAVMKENSRIQM